MATFFRHPGKFAIFLWAAFAALFAVAAGAELGQALFFPWLLTGGVAIVASAVFLIKLAVPAQGMPFSIYQKRLLATVIGFVALGGAALFLVFAFALYVAFKSFT
jgi:hypothetical protein